jgi:hypothetical protein
MNQNVISPNDEVPCFEGIAREGCVKERRDILQKTYNKISFAKRILLIGYVFKYLSYDYTTEMFR